MTPVPYVADFLTKAEADSLFAACEALPHVRLKNPRNSSFYRKVKYPSYSFPFTDAPPEIRMIADRLTQLAGKQIMHIGIGGYANAHDGMNYHQHKKDHGVIADQTIYVVSVGDDREIGIRRKGERGKGETFRAAHGSLYILPHAYNTTHEHSVLENKTPCGLRFCIDASTENRPWNGD